MRRAAYIFAPVLAATAASVLSGCHEAKVRHDAPTVESTTAVRTQRGGFGASFNPLTLYIVALFGVVVLVFRSDGAGG